MEDIPPSPRPHPVSAYKPEEPPKVYIPPDQVANGMPAAEEPKYGKLGIDGIMAIRIPKMGYLVMRTHETDNGPVAGVSIYTEAEAADFED